VECPVWEGVACLVPSREVAAHASVLWEGESEVSSQETDPVKKQLHELTTDDEWEDEGEGMEDTMCPDGGLQVGPAMALLEELQHEILPEAPHTAVDNVMDVLRDHPVLCTARD